MNERVRQALKATSIDTDEHVYCIVHLPARAITPAAGLLAQAAQPFSAVLVDRDEVTLILQQDYFETVADRLPEYEVARDYRLLTFDLPLSLDLVGFMSVVSTALARANVPLMAFSAYQRDHLLIQKQHFDTALQALVALKGRAAG